ncbi:MAG: nucleoside hydrolase, partial [Anaerolineae bacterium]|nr:nucleoside hydrolase [Anaerolineae bacterium]
GVQAIVDVILSSPEPVTLLCIGPAPNIAEALRREPRIAQNARFVGMHGALREGYGGSLAVVPEYNVKVHPADCRAAFEAPWPITITPLDTCGKIMLTGDLYQQVLNSPNPVARLVVENYRIWRKNQKADWAKDFDAALSSTVLYDTVAVFLCFSEQWLVMEELGVRVDDQGYTLLDETAPRMRCATAWTDLSAFERFLVKRLIH